MVADGYNEFRCYDLRPGILFFLTSSCNVIRDVEVRAHDVRDQNEDNITNDVPLDS